MMIKRMNVTMPFQDRRNTVNRSEVYRCSVWIGH